MALYKGSVKLAGIGTGFNPQNTGTEGQVLTKTNSGYAWCDNVTTPKYGFVDVLVVGGGGGGGGGCGSYSVGGGGGAGGVVYAESYPLISTIETVSIAVGAGGRGSYSDGSGCDVYNSYLDRNSCFKDIVAFGGGQGGGPNFAYAKSGASGGGANGYSYSSQGCAIEGGGCGHDGGWACCIYSGGSFGGGGGGAGSGMATMQSCNGGDALQYDISGTLEYYGGGGAGVCGTPGCGGGYPGGDGCSGCDATGCGGGGGGASSGQGGKGGNGVVIVRYKTDGSCGVMPQSYGGCKYTCGDYTIHCFTNTGAFVPVFK